MDFPPVTFTYSDIYDAVHLARAKAETDFNLQDIKIALSCIDLTTLNSTDTISFVASFVHKVNRFDIDFPDMPDVAAICVYPNMVSIVKETLAR